MTSQTVEMKFIRAVYLDAPELALASFNEKKCLGDATELINHLRSELSALRSKYDALREAADRMSESIRDLSKNEMSYDDLIYSRTSYEAAKGGG